MKLSKRRCIMRTMPDLGKIYLLFAKYFFLFSCRHLSRRSVRLATLWQAFDIGSIVVLSRRFPIRRQRLKADSSRAINLVASIVSPMRIDVRRIVFHIGIRAAHLCNTMTQT
jgi:hypothetical protein